MDRHQLEGLARPIAAGVVILLTLLLLIGAAIRDPRPHDVRVGVTGPAAAVDPLVAGLRPERARRVQLHPVRLRAGRPRGNRCPRGCCCADRRPDRPEPGGRGCGRRGRLRRCLWRIHPGLPAQGVTLPVEIVHAYPAGDAHGIVLFFLLLATLASSVVAGATAVLGGGGRSARTVSGVLVTFAVTAAIAGVLAAMWLGADYGSGTWATLGVLALAALATSSMTAALGRWIGLPGVGLTALVLVLLGLVSSGGPLGPQLLPDAYRVIAPWLPVGPAIEALRGSVAFGGSGVIVPSLVLAAWALLGLIGIAAAGMRPPGPEACSRRGCVTLHP